MRIDRSVFCSSQDHLRTETRDLDHHVLAGAKNTDSCRLHCRVMLAIALLRQLGHGAMSLPSYAGDGAAE
jgi:hypothetical protein